MGSYSRELMAEPTPMRYGAGLRFVGIQGSLVVAVDHTGVEYVHDTRYADGLNLHTMRAVALVVRLDHARRWFVDEGAAALFVASSGTPYESKRYFQES